MAKKYHCAKARHTHLTGHVKTRSYHGWMEHCTQEFLIIDATPANSNGCD